MCGIFGVIGTRLEYPSIRGAVRSLNRRGPDDWGVWTSDWASARQQRLQPPVGHAAWSAQALDDAHWRQLQPLDVTLAHTRLSIIDLSRKGFQPMVAEGPVVLVFNGEIYNYVELREELRRLGHGFESSGDSEVLLRSYMEWGDDCLRRLNGFFAFAVWDGQRGEVFAARDRLGKKPFYYQIDPLCGAFVFASEIKALWETGIATPRMDEAVAGRYLALGRQPESSESVFSGICQLPSGAMLTWRPASGALRIDQYWCPQVTFDSTPEGASEQLEHLLRDSVRLRFRSDVPVGICLSGGVDSGSILATAANIQESAGVGRLMTFTAEHEDAHLNERASAEAMLARYPEVCANFIPTSTQASYEEFLRFVHFHDEPVTSDGVFNQYLFMRGVKEMGVKVLLSGQGSDELFLGYPWYIGRYVKWLVAKRRFHEALRWLREERSRSGESWTKRIVGALTDLSARRRLDYKRRSVERWTIGNLWKEYCEEPFASEIGGDVDWASFHLGQIRTRSLPSLLKDEDRNSMNHGIETRLPYLDYRIAEWALTLSPTLHMRDGVTKHLVRTAYSKCLPQEVVWSKKKQGFYVPFTRKWTEHREYAKSLITASSELGKIVDVSAFLRMADQRQVDEQLQWRCFNLAAALSSAAKRSETARILTPQEAR